MARPRSESYPDNQALILDTAARLFAQKGFPRTSIAELARACNFSKAWLYHYYDSKEAILHALLKQHILALQAASRRALAGKGAPQALFRDWLAANLALYIRAPAKHVVLMNELDCLPDEQAEEIRAMERGLVEDVVALLLRINPRLGAHPGLRKPYAMMLYGLLNWTYVWYDPEGPVAPDRLADLAADLFLNGFLSQPPEQP